MKKTKVLMVALSLVMLISAFGSYTAFANGNFSDTSFEYQTDNLYVWKDVSWHCYDYDNEHIMSGHRAKLNSTATYVYNKGDVDGSFKVVGYDNRNEGATPYYEDTLVNARINVGEKRFIRQYVYENGHAACGLHARPVGRNFLMYGDWSPDSIGSYPYAN